MDPLARARRMVAMLDAEPDRRREDEAGVRPGIVLAGKYRVERVLGAGGMGVVVAAHHLQLDQRVALKFLLPRALQDGEALARFEREGRAAVKIRSEHVARIIDVGNLENGAPYLVMEHLDGLDLSTWLEQRGTLALTEAVDFVLQACEAVAEAHALGIVHRDLKPGNLFCVRRADGLLSIKVLDFGISKLTSGRELHMTSTTAVVGSPLYMSPEQMESSRAVDPRTDVWALGVVLFELLTGHTPFEAETLPMLALRIVHEPPPPMSAYRAGVPPELEHAIHGALVKDRERRFRSVAAFASALRPFASDRGRISIGTIERVSRVGEATEPEVPEMRAAAYPSSPGSGSGHVSGQRSGPDGVRTASAWGTSHGDRPDGKRSGAVWPIVGVVAVMAAAGAAVGLRWYAVSHPTTSAEGHSEAGIEQATTNTLDAAGAAGASAAAGGADAASSAGMDAATGMTSATASASASATVSATGSASVVLPPPPRPHPTVHPLPSASADCTTPYYRDANNNRVYKTECL